jgi:site-specific DNA-methyltransferase (adenine-specific)
MKENTAMYMFCSMDKVDFFKQELEKYFKVKNIIIWVKNNWTAGDLEAQFGKQYEIIFLVNKGRKLFNGVRLTDIWQFDRVAGNMQKHQNQKPIKLFEQCIIKHSNENDIILDPFAGSGTTAIASIRQNRNYILIEREQKYIDIINERIENELDKLKILFED